MITLIRSTFFLVALALLFNLAVFEGTHVQQATAQAFHVSK